MKRILSAMAILGMGTAAFALERLSVSPAISVMFLDGTYLCAGYRIGIGVPISTTEVVNVDYFDFTRAYFLYGPKVPETYKGIRIAKPITIKIEDVGFKITPGINLITENIFSKEPAQRVGVSVEFDGEHPLGENTRVLTGINFISDGSHTGISYFIGGKGYLNFPQ